MDLADPPAVISLSLSLSPSLSLSRVSRLFVCLFVLIITLDKGALVILKIKKLLKCLGKSALV